MSFAKTFKSVVTLNLTEAADLNAINEITDRPFQYVPAGEWEQESIGLIHIDGEFVKEFAGLQVINIGSSVKKVNKKKVKRLVKERVAQMQAQYAENNPGETLKVSKEDKDIIAEEITFSLLPETEVDEFQNLLIIDKDNSQVFIVNTTKKASEKLTDFVRDLIDSFSVESVVKDESKVVAGFAELMTGDITTRLALGNYIKLADADGVVVWTKESLYQSEASELLETGKQVQAIGLDYDAVVTFVVDTEFTLKSIKFDKSFQEDGTFEANVLAIVNELRGVISDLKEETFSK